jgi:eukaryotic-like serine/threonine-protein kinase
MPPPPLGSIGRYKLVKRIAFGGMAEVFLAKHEGPGGFARNLVVKRILPHLSSDSSFTELFLDEAKLSALLNHPNIVQVYDFGEADGSYFMAMELIRGPDLMALIRGAKKVNLPMPVPIAAGLMTQVMKGLDYAHRAVDDVGKPLGIIHRDISPHNVLVRLDGIAKVTDFGIAKASTQQHHTEAGQVKGKFSYLSPEQLRGETIDQRCDIFAAGLVFFELLTGEKALGEGELAVRNLIDGTLRSLEELRPEVDPEVRQIVSIATQLKPEDRYPTSRDMATALDKYLAAQGGLGNPEAIAVFIKTVQVDTGDPLSITGTGSLSGEHPVVAATAAPKAAPAAVKASVQASASAKPAKAPLPTKPAAAETVIRAPLSVAAEAPPTRIGRAPAARSPLASPGLTVRASEEVNNTMDDDLGVRETLIGGQAYSDEGAEPLQSDALIDTLPPGTPLTSEELEEPSAPRSRSRVLLWGSSFAAAVIIGAGVFIFMNRADPGQATAPTPLRGAGPAATSVAPVANAPTAPPSAEPASPPNPPTLTPVAANPEKTVEKPVPPPVPAVQPPPLVAVPAVEKRPAVHAATTPKPAKHAKGQKVATIEGDAPAATPPIPAAEPATLSINAVPWGDVSIDGRLIGRTPLLKAAVVAGEHTLKLANGDLGLTYTRALKIDAGEDHREMLKLAKGKVLFVVVPFADVTIGKKAIGQTPLPPQELYEGTYDVTFSNSGLGKTETRKVKVAAGEQTTVRLDLRK